MKHRSKWVRRIWIIILLLGITSCICSFAPREIVSDKVTIGARHSYSTSTPYLIGRAEGKINCDSLDLLIYIMDGDNYLNWKNKLPYKSIITTRWTKEYEFDFNRGSFASIYFVFYNTGIDPNYPTHLELEVRGIIPISSPFLYIGLALVFIGIYIKRKKRIEKID
jgi:hypothetical protein